MREVHHVMRIAAASPPSSRAPLGEALPAGTLHHIHHHAVVLLESIPPTSPSSLLDQEEGDVIELYVCKPPEVLLVCGADRIEHRQQLHRAALN